MAEQTPTQIAEQRIEKARKSGATSLDLSYLKLTELPASIGQLTQLRELEVYNNQLTALPEWFGQLTQLQQLDVAGNRLTALPESLGRLMQLRILYLGTALGGNPLGTLPTCIRKMRQLEILWLKGCRLAILPNWLSDLDQLVHLWIGCNPLGELAGCVSLLKRLKRLQAEECGFKTIPSWVGELEQLDCIWLHDNLLIDLPASIGQLDHLGTLDVSNNPLNPELAAAYKEGLEAVKRYLREMAKGARKRYEAKLLILGDGNEGKTCVSRALRNLPFRVQKTTHGVDVVQWKFPHPDDTADRKKDITLNIWDFEGQEISHQTHQFFLTSQSLYLLVFKCRDQFLMDRAEYWLDTIRARAPKAKVAIVITQCEERTPLVPLDRLQSQYGDLLAKEWFFAVGCKNGLNIEKLQTFLHRWAADLEFMGSAWPTSYGKAEKTIKAMAEKRTTHMSRDKLHAIFAKAGVSEDGYEDAAAALSRLGAITQFPDCLDLQDFVVLQPQWLTKAISKVMEDGKLTEDQGEIELKRMEGIWNKAGYRGMFATFHNCMKEFELCYDLEDGNHSCLVPLRFGYLPPAIPWSTGEGVKERRVEYKLNIRPPMGIMSRFIVKTHHMIVTTPDYPKGVYWHNGVFLSTGEGQFRSEALCEFVPEDRKLRIEVRAAFPQNMSEQIHAYVKAVFSFFSGLAAERSYGCMKEDEKTLAEQRCSGLHTEKRIYSAISKQRVLDCEFEGHDVDPMKLIWGFGSFSEFVRTKMVPLDQLRRELDKPPEWAAPFMRGVGALLDWVNDNNDKIDLLLQGQSAFSAEFKQEVELKLHEYLALSSEMLDDRDHTAAPGLISIRTKDRSKWNPTGYFKSTYVLTPYCECNGNIHACKDGRVEFTKDKDWWDKTAPWIARGTKVLAAGLQLAFAGMPLALGSQVCDAVKDDVKFMTELSKHIELKGGEKENLPGVEEVVQGDVGKDLREDDRESRITRAALARLLEETAPNKYRARRWGSLRRVRMSDNSYRWLCEECAKNSR